MFRKRKSRRAQERFLAKARREAERLALLATGGSPDKPFVVETPAIVDLRAESLPCPLCQGALKLKDHTAVEIDGTRLRVAAVSCKQCGAHRSLYFRLAGPTVH